jgi:hypothetical protein
VGDAIEAAIVRTLDSRACILIVEAGVLVAGRSQRDGMEQVTLEGLI